MATYNSILKSNSWLTADEFGEWLGVKEEQYAVPTEGIAAELTEQFIKYTAQNVGVAGNNITVEYIGGGTKGSEVVTVTVDAIQVQIEDGVSTAEDIRSAVSASGLASALVSVELVVEEPDTLPDVEVRTQNIMGPKNLVGGVDDEPFSSDPKTKVQVTRKRYEQLINTACTKIESIIQTNVLAKTFQEDLDGNDSNVIVPSAWPILEVDEVKIDFNRNFGPETVVDEINQILRGMADRRQDVNELPLRIIGSNVYLRDDDNDNVIGRIFSGSVAGSVRIKYKAGWALDSSDVPDDLKIASLQLAEWYEFRRSNRDVGVASKGVRGESYSKFGELEQGIPLEIYGLLETYINYGFGNFERIQNNIFGV